MRFLSFFALLFLTATCYSQEQRPTVTNSLDMVLVRIAPCKFRMGAEKSDKWADDDEQPAFDQEITQPYWIQATEVTRGMFDEFCSNTGYVTDLERDKNHKGIGSNGTWRDKDLDQDPELPVVNVSHNDALAFCLWLSGREGKKYRLPTEPEWEYACRAGSDDLFSGTSDLLELCRDNCIGLSDIEEIRAANPEVRGKPWKCKSGKPNAYGLFDMSGNVNEIVDSYHLPYAQGVIQPSKLFRSTPKSVVVRGGSFKSGPEFARCSSRSWMKRDGGTESTGFRVVLEMDLPESKKTDDNNK